MPYSDGILGIGSFIDWIADVVKIIYYAGVPEEKKISLIACMLKKYSFSWWKKFVNK